MSIKLKTTHTHTKREKNQRKPVGSASTKFYKSSSLCSRCFDRSRLVKLICRLHFTHFRSQWKIDVLSFWIDFVASWLFAVGKILIFCVSLASIFASRMDLSGKWLAKNWSFNWISSFRIDRFRKRTIPLFAWVCVFVSSVNIDNKQLNIKRHAHPFHSVFKVIHIMFLWIFTHPRTILRIFVSWFSFSIRLHASVVADSGIKWFTWKIMSE